MYYRYNSANLVTSVRVADPLRQYTTFYGYNYNGQVDSIWTHLEEPGSGVLALTPTMRADILQRPLPFNRTDSLGTAEISYRYTPLGSVEQMFYPLAQMKTDYWYNKRGWLDSLESQYTIVAPKLFVQKLSYDSVGRIVSQESKNGSQGSWLSQGYEYDDVDRLVGWSVGTDTTAYSYDEVGNRQTRASMIGGATYTYGAPTTGPNRLTERDEVTVSSTERMYYGYNLNGSIVERKEYDQLAVPQPSLLSEEYFGYSYRELNWRYVSGDPFSNSHSDWRYRYNAMGEREQKRLYHAPLADSIVGQPYPWVHYLLGGSKDQLAVWHGQQMTSPFCDTVRRRNVFLYPTEYLTNGIGWNGVHEDITPIITKPDGSKEYRISDHLASLRVSLSNGTPGQYFDYDPWGSLLTGTPTRRMYNDREEDKESSLYNNGVRKLDEGLGRFTSIDPLWEKCRWQSPYVYGDNNPMGKTDPTGMQAQFKDIAIGIGTVVAANPETWPIAAGIGGLGLLGADFYVRTKYPWLNSFGSQPGSALGAYIGLTLATEFFPAETIGSSSSADGESGSPSGGSGGGGLGAGLGAAGIAAAQQMSQKGNVFSQDIIDKAVNFVMKNGNDLKHIFAAKHNLDGLVNKLGGQKNTIKTVLDAANGKMPADGIFKDIPVVVEGETVFLRGSVVNGIPRIGTMFKE